MTRVIKPLVSYAPRGSDRLLLDASAWLHIQGPLLPSQSAGKVTVYSSALERCLKAGCELYIDVLVLSEFVNVCARFYYKLKAPSIGFKEYRASPGFKPLAESIAADARFLLSKCRRIDSCFETIDTAKLLLEF